MREATAPVPPSRGEGHVLVGEPDPTYAPPARTRAKARIGRAAAGERWIVRILQGGALISGGMFLASLVLELLPPSQDVAVSIDTLRKSAASLLLVTPVARLAVAGTMLGLRGEWRYTLYAVGVLSLLAIAVGAGLHA
ncbi:hypothetical protein POL68_11525 [Stigmatella sp. ncwal1]|uniref:DUF1634 domain-containing protein n=1 Tax=Stigmatella ashevillensis TaxID=2995309 RepID=A0ABT5D7H2_9BACT|nr:hypothetical protein [Stigmatella ashevillena]MDC0709093.1 hypothetical protein [Stigmatella ashevillena]